MRRYRRKAGKIRGVRVDNVRIFVNKQTVKKYLDMKNLRQNGFAIEIGVSDATVSRLLNKKQEPTLEMQKRLFLATGIKADDMYQYEIMERG
ncbi:helix-turn-helix domain-containing protein [bacterium]|nr:helix-turn-helix domain-containing protein [bacterium]